MIDLEKIRSAPVAKEPFPYFVAENIVSPGDLKKVGADFPNITSTGVYPLSELAYGPAFEQLITDIRSAGLEELIEEKLGVDLSDKPLMITVRGHCHKRDGRIHTDSKDKVVTCLLYLNEANWQASGGRLRLLRNETDIEDVIAEVPPFGGTLVVFRRTDNSWHGHHPFEGQRRYIMFNWVTSEMTLAKNIGRHRFSAVLKRLNPFS